ncbi:hypothetical protein B0I35DRAFT_412090 [Stachybotrys elegans]|uniref:Uncharacterized protein n=1 Tax=Stachybotrys elegans TaxID=80388 RepID=A0A8K0SK32_9HYPO|nr:hypothetical protein B0I35DRAFT_412090 [Stachybotrys elegans]
MLEVWTPFDVFCEHMWKQPDFATTFRDKETRGVYVPAEMSHPLGAFFQLMTKRKERMSVFMVALFGQRNPRTCSHCATTYLRTITGAREHVLYPFNECITLPGHFHDACANCIWAASGATCEYCRFPGYLTDASTRFHEDIPFYGREAGAVWGDLRKTHPPPAEMLDNKSAPRLVRVEPSDDVILPEKL